MARVRPSSPPGGEGLKDPAAEGIIQGHRLLPGACQLLQQVQKSPPVSAAADEVCLQLPGSLRGDLGIAAAERHQRPGRPLPGLPDRLPGFLIAGGRHGAAVDEIDIGLGLKGHQAVSPGPEELLHGLALVLIHFAPQGVDGNAHGEPPVWEKCFSFGKKPGIIEHS